MTRSSRVGSTGSGSAALSPGADGQGAVHSVGPHRDEIGGDQAATLRRLMRTGTSVAPLAGARAGGSLISVSATGDARAALRDAPQDRGVRDDHPDLDGQRRQRRVARIRLARAIAITSGKGGVGKTNLAVNLSIALAHERRVCLLDADLGMANVDVLCGLSPRATLEDVLQHGRRIDEVMVLAPGGFRLVPGASGVASVANLGLQARRRLLAQLAALERHADMLVIDTAAGIASNSIAFAAAAHTVLVAVTPEPTSITDAYGAVKTIASKVREPRIRIVVNMANDRDEGEEVFRRIDRVSRTFLDLPLVLGGIVPFDPAVRACVRRREPVLLSEPDCPASKAIRAVARGVLAADDADRLALYASRSSPRAGSEGTGTSSGSTSGAGVSAGEGQPNSVSIDPDAFTAARDGFLSRLVGWLRRG
jgi:flagellar biosynthesis protein FlhG